MKQIFEMTVELTPKDIQDAIAQYVTTNIDEEGLAVHPDKVNVMVGKRLVGSNAHDQYEEVYLKGAKVKVSKLGAYSDR